MGVVHCCWKCERRVPGCHSDCEDYKEAMIRVNKIREERYKRSDLYLHHIKKGRKK